MLNRKLLRAVLRSTGLSRATWGFLVTFVAASALLALVDPGVGSLSDALWCCFQAVTTIGYGDITVTSPVGRAIVVALSVVGILFVAVLTAAVVSYSNELMLARRNESLALYLDKLEHLDQLSRDELAELSRNVRQLRGSRE
jgi:voltage-gated potassium channel